MTDTISKAAKARAVELANADVLPHELRNYEDGDADTMPSVRALARVLQEHSDKAREVKLQGMHHGWREGDPAYDILQSMILPDDEPEEVGVAWNEGTPPRDGTWVVELHDDSSGAVVIAWYLDEHGQEGWHEAEGDYYSDDPNIKTRWIAAPRGFVPWIENISAANQGAVEAAWDEAESETHPAPITLTYFMKALDAAGYEIRRKDG